MCLLHAHVEPRHERRVGEILRTELPGIPVSLSSEILRERQEYERTATTVVNAYVRPLMSHYLTRIREGLDAAKIAAPLRVMQSSGGLTTDQDAAVRPVLCAGVRPGGGVVASAGARRAAARSSRMRSASTWAVRPPKPR